MLEEIYKWFVGLLMLIVIGVLTVIKTGIFLGCVLVVAMRVKTWIDDKIENRYGEKVIIPVPKHLLGEGFDGNVKPKKTRKTKEVI